MFPVFRDKYLTQLQLMYTEKLAKKGCIKQGGVVEKISEKYVEDDDTKVDVAEKKEMNQMLARKRNDKRYGPCYERVTVLDSERYQMGDEVDFLQGCYNAERVRRQEEDAKVEAEQEESVRIVRQVNGQTVEDSTENKRKSFVNPGYLDADTMLAFLAVTDEEKLAAADTTERTLPFIYRDTTHSRALLDVKVEFSNSVHRYSKYSQQAPGIGTLFLKILMKPPYQLKSLKIKGQFHVERYMLKELLIYKCPNILGTFINEV